MNCDQIIYLGIFAIVAIYLYQNVLTPQYEGFTPFEGGQPSRQPSNVAVGNANAAAANANAAAQNGISMGMARTRDYGLGDAYKI